MTLRIQPAPLQTQADDEMVMIMLQEHVPLSLLIDLTDYVRQQVVKTDVHGKESLRIGLPPRRAVHAREISQVASPTPSNTTTPRGAKKRRPRRNVRAAEYPPARQGDRSQRRSLGRAVGCRQQGCLNLLRLTRRSA